MRFVGFSKSRGYPPCACYREVAQARVLGSFFYFTLSYQKSLDIKVDLMVKVGVVN